jgi:hypothetical protein
LLNCPTWRRETLAQPVEVSHAKEAGQCAQEEELPLQPVKITKSFPSTFQTSQEERVATLRIQHQLMPKHPFLYFQFLFRNEPRSIWTKKEWRNEMEKASFNLNQVFTKTLNRAEKEGPLSVKQEATVTAGWLCGW